MAWRIEAALQRYACGPLTGCTVCPRLCRNTPSLAHLPSLVPQWAGQFAGVSGKKSRSWIRERNIVAMFEAGRSKVSHGAWKGGH